jgi:hypothetical protein
MGIFIFYVIFVGGTVAAISKSPKYALYLYLFVYFCTNERVFWWTSLLPGVRWSLVAAFIVLISCFIHFKKLKNKVSGGCPSMKWLIALFLLMLATLPFALFPDISSGYVYYFFCYVVIFILITMALDDLGSYQLFIWIFLTGCFYYSYYAYISPIRIHGRLEMIGPPTASDSNTFAALLLTTVPFIVARLLKSSWKIRAVAFVFLVFIINAIVLCSSRGAVVGLAAAMCAYIIFEKNWKIRSSLILGTLLVVVAFFYLSDETILTRLSTLTDPSVEGAGGRMTIWAHVFNMFKDYPFGTGGRGVAFLSPQYMPPELLAGNGLRAAHNTYLTILTENGFLGLFLFVGFIATTLTVLFRLRKNIVNDSSSFEANESLYIETGALISSIIGLLTCSIFVDRVYFEPLYWLCALACVLMKIYKVNNDSQAVQC